LKHSGFATRAIHIGQEPDPLTGAVTVPIYATSTYVQEEIGKHKGYEYARVSNPTRDRLETNLAALEGGTASRVFASGMAAATTALFELLKGGDHVVLTSDCYRRTRQFVTRFLSRLGVESTLVEPGDEAALRAALRPGRTKVILAESPTNPYLRVADLSLFARARDACPGANLIIDGTFATPVNQRPLAHGVDLVIHSCTKYLGGHNDLLAGAVCGRAGLVQAIKDLRGVLGGVLDPQSAFLLIRGLKTLPLRVQRQNETALAVARWLEQHPRVHRVFYPGLPSHPDHAIALKQMRGFGGVVSFRVRGDARATSRVIDACRLATIAPSLGATETLIEQPAYMSYFELTTEERQAIGIHDDLVRLSLGLEDAEDVIADLQQALSA